MAIKVVMGLSGMEVGMVESQGKWCGVVWCGSVGGGVVATVTPIVKVMMVIVE